MIQLKLKLLKENELKEDFTDFRLYMLNFMQKSVKSKTGRVIQSCGVSYNNYNFGGEIDFAQFSETNVADAIVNDEYE